MSRTTRNHNHVVLTGTKAFLRIAELAQEPVRRLSKADKKQINRLMRLGVSREKAEGMTREERQSCLKQRQRQAGTLGADDRKKSQRAASAMQVQLLLAMGVPDWIAARLSEVGAEREIEKWRNLPPSRKQLDELKNRGLDHIIALTRGKAAELIVGVGKRPSKKKQASRRAVRRRPR